MSKRTEYTQVTMWVAAKQSRPAATCHISVCRWWFTTRLTQFTDNKACSRASSLRLNFWITHTKYTNKFLFCRVMPYEIILIPRNDCLLGKGNLASGVSTTVLLPSMRSTWQSETRNLQREEKYESHSQVSKEVRFLISGLLQIHNSRMSKTLEFSSGLWC